MNRRCFMTCLGLVAIAFSIPGCSGKAPQEKQEEILSQPNVLFISVDDLNDWIEPLGGHSQAITPNLKQFADQSVCFTHNYCASAACKPSRSALLTGIHCYGV